eukprot:symbB.v1.2.001547.t1/scaffold85.1/size341090/7
MVWWKLGPLAVVAATGSFEVRCLETLHRKHDFFSSAWWSHSAASEDILATCQQPDFATAMLQVHLPRKELYLQRIGDDLRARGAFGKKCLKLITAKNRVLVDPDKTLEEAEIEDGECLTALVLQPQLATTGDAFAFWFTGDSEIVVWGDVECGGDNLAVPNQRKGVEQIQATGMAFAAILEDGSVVAWGDEESGGDSSAVRHRGVQQIQATGGRWAFAAIQEDGSVVTWGDVGCGGDSSAVRNQLKDVQQIQAARHETFSGAFAAILHDGSVVAWGDADFGGDNSAVRDQLKGVQQIQASRGAFAAILEDGSVATEDTFAVMEDGPDQNTTSLTPQMRGHRPGREHWAQKVAVELWQGTGCKWSRLRKEETHAKSNSPHLTGHSLRGNLSSRLLLCLPHACVGHGSLLRLGVHYNLLVHALQVPPPLPRAIQPSELRWRILHTHGVATEAELGGSTSDKLGQCLCSQDMDSRNHSFTVREAACLRQDLQRPGILRQRSLARVSAALGEFRSRTLPSYLAPFLPNKCYHAHVVLPESCAAETLSNALLLVAAARRPADLLAHLDDALRAALVMRDCPWPLLDAFACDDCYGPPPGFRIGSLVEKTRAAHLAFAKGGKRLKDPLQWTQEMEWVEKDGDDSHRSPLEGEMSACNLPEFDAKYQEEAKAAHGPAFRTSGFSPMRVACLYLAALPNDSPAIRRSASTFARHCDWASFFAAPNREKEGSLLGNGGNQHLMRLDGEKRETWRITVQGRDFEIVNLAQVFPEAQADESWMQTQWEGEAVKDVFRTRLWSGNTIQKSLLMAVYTARHRLEHAEFFCWLELDSAFVAENLRAFARVHGLVAEEAVFIAALHLGMKLQMGIFPHTAGGVCITREALRRLSQYLERQPMDALTYPFPREVGFWAPTLTSPGATAKRVNGCAFVAGHWWDIMLGRCFVASNVSAHPAIEDAMGRYYFATEPLPCQEHLRSRSLPTLPTPRVSDRFQRLAGALCATYGFYPELHRYVPCEPDEVPPVAGYHGYKNLSLLLHAYRVLYRSEACDWALPFRPKAPWTAARVLLQEGAIGLPIDAERGKKS